MTQQPTDWVCVLCWTLILIALVCFWTGTILGLVTLFGSWS